MKQRSKKTVSAVQSAERKLRHDVIFILLLLLVVSILGALWLFLCGDGDTVRVTVDGRLYGTYSLSKDARIEIRGGADGERLNVLIIRDGKAYVEKASCPDGICSAHRAVWRDGESILCLPNRVAITVYASEEAPDAAA